MKKIGTKSKIKLYIIIEAVLIAMIIGMSIFFGIALNNRRVDFDQNVTSVDGSEFNSTFDAKGDDDFVVRFADLECNEDCSNVSSVKIGDKTLEVGKDYEVKRGSVIIRIFKKVLQAITNGEYDIVVKINQGGETITVGVKITITNSTATNEQPEQNTEPENNGGSSQNNPAPEPTPTPTPTPEPQSGRLRINLNDPSYTVEYFAVHTYRVDENRNAIYENGALASYRAVANCTIYKDGVQIHQVRFKSDNPLSLDGRTFLTEQQYTDALNNWVMNRGEGYDGEGGGFGPTEMSGHEALCSNCDVDCGRW